MRESALYKLGVFGWFCIIMQLQSDNAVAVHPQSVWPFWAFLIYIIVIYFVLRINREWTGTV